MGVCRECQEGFDGFVEFDGCGFHDGDVALGFFEEHNLVDEFGLEEGDVEHEDGGFFGELQGLGMC